MTNYNNLLRQWKFIIIVKPDDVEGSDAFITAFNVVFEEPGHSNAKKYSSNICKSKCDGIHIMQNFWQWIFY